MEGVIEFMILIVFVFIVLIGVVSIGFGKKQY